ncbi:MAG TPA: hypothetical protein VHL08_04140 [Dongiaceae bacterium]|nr:hypothetical protein [Dongiaceae bacterium]
MRMFLLCLCLCLSVAARAEQEQALSTIPNLPLAPGLKEQVKDGSVMDWPLGHIIIAYARGDGPARAVRDYYARALPKLGWNIDDHGLYHRGREMLKVDFIGADRDPVIVTFTYYPSPS